MKAVLAKLLLLAMFHHEIFIDSIYKNHLFFVETDIETSFQKKVAKP